MNRDRNSPMPSGFTPVRVEGPIGRRTQLTAALLGASNWWTDDAGIDVVSLTPQGEPLVIFPEKLTIPSEIWVTNRGFAVDGWIFFGWSLWVDVNSDRLDAWLDVWNEASDGESLLERRTPQGDPKTQIGRDSNSPCHARYTVHRERRNCPGSQAG
jgi:hypothetical protein